MIKINQKLFWILVLVISLGFGIWVLGFFGLGGCASTQQLPENTTTTSTTTTSSKTTTTTTTSTTTTTLPHPATTWQNIGGVTLNGSPEGAWVDALVCDSSGDLYVGGRFDSAGGVPARNIAKWKHANSSWERLAGGLDFDVLELAFDPLSGNIYAGGAFKVATNPGGVSVEVNEIARWNVASGTWSRLGSGVSYSNVYGSVVILALTVDPSGNVYAGGTFDHAGGVPANNVAQWKTASSTWDAMRGGVLTPVYGAQVWDLVLVDGDLYVGGAFATSETVPVSDLAKWKVSSATWEALSGWNGGQVTALEADDSGNIYVIGSYADTSVYKWNGSTWQNFLLYEGSGIPSVLAVKSPNEIYLGHHNNKYITKWDGSSWKTLTGELINSSGQVMVWALAFDPAGNLYVGGNFTSAGGIPVVNLVKIINP